MPQRPKELTTSDLVSIIVVKVFGRLVIFEASEPTGKRIIRPASAPARFKVWDVWPKLAAEGSELVVWFSARRAAVGKM